MVSVTVLSAASVPFLFFLDRDLQIGYSSTHKILEPLWIVAGLGLVSSAARRGSEVQK